MEDWLSHPAVQAAGLPFVAGLVVALMLARTRFVAVAQVAGFAATASVVLGWSFEPMTSTRKLVLVSIASLMLCAAIELRRERFRHAAAGTCIFMAAGCTWMLWRLLAQKEFPAALLAGAAAGVYVAAQAVLFLRAGSDPVRSVAAASALGFGTGAAAILGASVVLGTLSLAIGSAAVATLAVQFARDSNAPRARSIALPAAAACGLAGVNATLAAELPGYVLLPLLAAAPITQFVPERLPVRMRAFACFALALVPAAAAVALAWFRPA